VVSGLFGKKPPAGTPQAPDTPPAGAAPQRTELSTIDFSGADVSRALAECADMVEVQEVGSGIGAAYEEAAILYANGNARDAETLLESILNDDSFTAGEGLWMMLLDLYKLTGQRERFESRVLDYATRFERSPPPWVDLSSSQPRRKADVMPLINLGGNLSGDASEQFKQILVIGQKSGAIRIDLKRLRSVDDTGCRLLLDVISTLAQDRVRVSLLNGAQLVAMLDGQIHPGRAEGRDMWLLMLELLQHTGEHERFEQLAVDYAITFEESPPSWEAREQAQPVMATMTQHDAADVDVISLEGELTGANSESIRKLAAYASSRQAVEVDCSRLKRLDFVSAGTLFNILATLQAQGKLVTLQGVNAMVAALLRVMSVDQVAQVTLRS
jgi:anti-anti-sigma regulatory factor